MEFVNDTRKEHQLIMENGHRVKSVCEFRVCWFESQITATITQTWTCKVLKWMNPELKMNL